MSAFFISLRLVLVIPPFGVIFTPECLSRKCTGHMCFLCRTVVLVGLRPPFAGLSLVAPLVLFCFLPISPGSLSVFVSILPRYVAPPFGVSLLKIVSSLIGRKVNVHIPPELCSYSKWASICAACSPVLGSLSTCGTKLAPRSLG